MSSSSTCQKPNYFKKTSRPLYGRALENCRKIMAGLRCHTEVYYKRRSLFWIRKIQSFRKVKANWLELRKEALSRKAKVVEDTKKNSPEKPEAEKRDEKLEIPNTPELESEENENCQI